MLFVAANRFELPLIGIDDAIVGRYFNVTTNTKFYFYWFFESRSNPATDPVVLWLVSNFVNRGVIVRLLCSYTKCSWIHPKHTASNLPLA